MVMNPRTHPRGARPDFTLPRPNPNLDRQTNALWWLVCMRLALEPKSRNGGTYADKPGYHNIGNNLPDHGEGDSRTDHSIRRAPDRTGPWWKTKTRGHDWTFVDAQAGDYRTITLYTKRLVNAMRDPADLRPDNVYAYTLGQVDNDRVVEGYNEYRDDDESSGDLTHLWHRHDSFRSNIVGDFWAMWKALTIDMGWTYAEWQKSVAPASVPVKEAEDMTPAEFRTEVRAAVQAELAEFHAASGTIKAGDYSTRIGRDAFNQSLPNPFNLVGTKTTAWEVLADTAEAVIQLRAEHEAIQLQLGRLETYLGQVLSIVQGGAGEPPAPQA